MLLKNVGNHLPDYTMVYPKNPYYKNIYLLTFPNLISKRLFNHETSRLIC